jgi:hypothetical protein
MKNLSAISIFALTILCFSRLSIADNFAYMGVSGGNFGTVDLDTGVFSSLGNSGQTLAGLAVANATLYGTSYHASGGTLFKVNTTNGALTTVGTSAVVYDDFGYTSSGTMYAVGTDANLYTINASTGATTLIGPTGLGFGSWRSLSIDTSLLYFADGVNLYTLNTATGASTLVGNMGGPQMGAILMEGGVVYGGEGTPDLRIDTLNTTTGAATLGPSLSGTTSGFYGFAPYPLTTRGDVDLNGHVDARDVTAMMAALTNITGYANLKTITTQQLTLIGDVNQDGKFTNGDLQSLIQYLKAGNGSATPVPEPSTLALLAVGAAVVVARRRVLSNGNAGDTARCR